MVRSGRFQRYGYYLMAVAILFAFVALNFLPARADGTTGSTFDNDTAHKLAMKYPPLDPPSPPVITVPKYPADDPDVIPHTEDSVKLGDTVNIHITNVNKKVEYIRIGEPVLENDFDPSLGDPHAVREPRYEVKVIRFKGGNAPSTLDIKYQVPCWSVYSTKKNPIAAAVQMKMFMHNDPGNFTLWFDIHPVKASHGGKCVGKSTTPPPRDPHFVYDMPPDGVGLLLGPNGTAYVPGSPEDPRVHQVQPAMPPTEASSASQPTSTDTTSTKPPAVKAWLSQNATDTEQTDVKENTDATIHLTELDPRYPIGKLIIKRSEYEKPLLEKTFDTKGKTEVTFPWHVPCNIPLTNSPAKDPDGLYEISVEYRKKDDPVTFAETSSFDQFYIRPGECPSQPASASSSSSAASSSASAPTSSTAAQPVASSSSSVTTQPAPKPSTTASETQPEPVVPTPPTSVPAQPEPKPSEPDTASPAQPVASSSSTVLEPSHSVTSHSSQSQPVVPQPPTTSSAPVSSATGSMTAQPSSSSPASSQPSTSDVSTPSSSSPPARPVFTLSSLTSSSPLTSVEARQPFDITVSGAPVDHANFYIDGIGTDGKADPARRMTLFTGDRSDAPLPWKISHLVLPCMAPGKYHVTGNFTVLTEGGEKVFTSTLPITVKKSSTCTTTSTHQPLHRVVEASAGQPLLNTSPDTSLPSSLTPFAHMPLAKTGTTSLMFALLALLCSTAGIILLLAPNKRVSVKLTKRTK